MRNREGCGTVGRCEGEGGGVVEGWVGLVCGPSCACNVAQGTIDSNVLKYDHHMSPCMRVPYSEKSYSEENFMIFSI